MVTETRESFLAKKCWIIEDIAAQHRISLRIQGGTIAPDVVTLQAAAQVGTKVSKVAALASQFAHGIGADWVSVYRRGSSLCIEVSRRRSPALRGFPQSRRPHLEGARIALERDSDAPVEEITEKYHMTRYAVEELRDRIKQREQKQYHVIEG